MEEGIEEEEKSSESSANEEEEKFSEPSALVEEEKFSEPIGKETVNDIDIFTSDMNLDQMADYVNNMI